MAHVKIQEELSSSDSEADNDSNDSNDEEMSDKESRKKSTPGGGLADVMAAILAKSSTKGKVILAKGQTDTEIRKRKRKREKEEGKIKDDDSESEVENRQERIDKRKEMNNLNRVKPNPLEREKERRLQRIATRGVVQLFNAVQQQQRNLEEQLTEAGSSIKKTEKVMGSMTKDKFMDILKGSKPTVKESSNTQGKKTKTSSGGPSKESGSDWKILRDDFMMGAKMKDWDKEEGSGGSAGESDEVGGEMDLSDSD